MAIRETFVGLIRESIDDINSERGVDSQIEFSEDLRLYGGGSPLDSLDFVNFTIGFQDRVLVETDWSLDLASILFDETAGHPFRTVAALADYLVAQQPHSAG